MPLYVRIWLAVIAAVAAVTLAFGWLWHASVQERPLREVIVRGADGEVLGRAAGRPAYMPGQGLEFTLAMRDGSTLYVQLPPRGHHAGGRPPARPMFRGTDGLLWLLAFIAVAVALASYPVIRRLTLRLEALRAGVERLGEGDLAARVDESGSDEAAALARRFNVAAARIEQLVGSHKSLLANASHELRSPLARIRMALALLDGERDPQPVRQEIGRNITELDQLVEEILLASRLDAPNADIGTSQAVDLTGLVAEECARADAELLAAADGQPVVVQGVPRLLQRLVRNLLENARRYSDGAVTVDLRATPLGARLQVCDQGPGVPADQRERIFEPFYRLPGASERSGGVGLGLSLVRSIAHRHGGTVLCEDPPEGRGACFVVDLPASFVARARPAR
jgi:two-component system, OmpR family, sensor kinase